MRCRQPFHELYAAYRCVFEARLAEALTANPRLQVTRAEGATHALVAERPAEIAQLITRFTETAATAETDSTYAWVAVKPSAHNWPTVPEDS